ncbi:MAG: hypothetical protein ACYTXA_06445 [Nostoc sp.]
MLNAYWHQRFGQSGNPDNQGLGAIGAQRLLASKVWAVLLYSLYSLLLLRCSTPTGIKGLGSAIAKTYIRTPLRFNITSTWLKKGTH